MHKEFNNTLILYLYSIFKKTSDYIGVIKMDYN